MHQLAACHTYAELLCLEFIDMNMTDKVLCLTRS